MAMPMGTESVRAAAPARIRTRRVSSVAYATEESASEEKTARPVALPSRSCLAWARGNRLPRISRLNQ